MTKEKEQKILDLEKQLESLEQDLQINKQLDNLKDEAYFRYQVLLGIAGITETLKDQAAATQELVTLSSEDEKD